MNTPKFFYSNWFISVVITVTVIAASLIEFTPLQKIEYKAYDLVSSMRTESAEAPIVLLDIDAKSIRERGPWPWPRADMATMVRLLTEYGAKTIGIQVLYPQKDPNPGLHALKKIRRNIAREHKVSKNRQVARIYRSLREAEKKADHDAVLVSSVKSSRRVVLPLVLSMGTSETEANTTLPVFLKRNSTTFKTDSRETQDQPVEIKNPFSQYIHKDVKAHAIRTPFDGLAAAARALGFNNTFHDTDGMLRRTPLFISYNDRFYPSFELQTVLRYLGMDEKNVKYVVEKGGFRGLKAKNLMIPTDGRFQMLINFNADRAGFMRHSFSDVLNGDVPPESFKNKIVIIGISDKSITKAHRTRIGENTDRPEISANIVENILNDNHAYRPSWAFILEAVILLFLGLFSSFLVPKVKKRMGIMLLGIFVGIWCMVSILLLLFFGLWFKPMSAVVLAIMVMSAIAFNDMLYPARLSAAENIESYKMLGLSLQSQGMLDMAFDNFMKCPVKDESIKGILYNLGLDFERKRMFNKAVAVYEHILKGGKYKDIKERIERFRSATDGSSLGAQGTVEDRTMLLDDSLTKPTLGRYEIIEELGRGAMGTVYLGRDPAINRDVAIKTLKYESMSDSELTEFKERFFREAEAAGTLSHPNIMTIYDIGEEHDMAYIAMELLKGNDLREYTNIGRLLPLKDVLKIISSVAEALAYAHENGIVHRDIKPANIMFLDDGSVKVADFGIATVTAMAETETGSATLIGTPNYMSPEQISGRNLDGRSDLFSLGCVLYELLAGEKPFQGDTMALLMQNIAKGNYIPVNKVASDLPKCVAAIADRLLSKTLKHRYKRGADVVVDIKRCLEKID